MRTAGGYFRVADFLERTSLFFGGRAYLLPFDGTVLHGSYFIVELIFSVRCKMFMAGLFLWYDLVFLTKGPSFAITSSHENSKLKIETMRHYFKLGQLLQISLISLIGSLV